MKHRAIIGIEIATDHVRGAWVRSNGNELQLAGVASAPIPAGAIDSEGMLDAAQVGETVRRVCANLDARANHVVTGITGCNLVARVMEIPPVPDSEVRSVLRGEMDHYRILPAGQSAFDFYRLPPPPGRGAGVEEEAVDRVLLMGAEERLVGSYRAAIDASGLHIAAVEPGSIAVLRALHPMLRAEQAVATVIFSAIATDIFITCQGELQFYRRVDTGTVELHASQGPAVSNAGPNQHGRGSMLVAEEETEPAPVQSDEAVDPYNRQAISLLMTEVQRSLDYFVREFPSVGESLGVRFVIDAPDASELYGVMTQYLRSQAVMAGATDCVPIDPEIAGQVSGAQGYPYTVAIGLALRNAAGEYMGAPALDLGVGDKVIVERRMAPKAMVLSGAFSGFILVGTIMAAFVLGNSIARANRTLDQTKNELAALTAEHAAKVAQLDRQKNLVEAIHRRDKPLREAMEFMSAAVNQGACITSMAVDKDGHIFLSGEAYSPRIVADIMDKINMSPVLDPIRLDNLSRLDNHDGTTPALKFDLQTAFSAQAGVGDPKKQGGS